MKEKVLDFALARYTSEATLIGDAEHVTKKITELKAIGVDEVACLIDFGIEKKEVMRSLDRLADIMTVVGEENVE